MYISGGSFNYIWLMILPMLLGMWAQFKVQSSFKKYSQVQSETGYTAAQMARRILDSHGLTTVSIEHISGSLSDHYDPTANVVRLSDTVYSSKSIAAIGIAAHECGHAVQHATGYIPIKIRSAIIPMTNIGSKLSIPLILVGALLSMTPLISIGLIAYGFISLFQLATLPVEFNASGRAVSVIKNFGVSEKELSGVKKVLSAAALTYVAALISAVTQFMRMYMIYGSRSRRR